MPLSNSILRRYTPPTCTLEIAAKTSPLSRFVGRSMLKDLHFELRFDDPRQPDDKRVTIRGDAGALDILYDAVNSYVQNFLESSSTQLPLTSQTSTVPTGSSHENIDYNLLPSPSASSTYPNPIAASARDQQPDELGENASVPNLESRSMRRPLHLGTLAQDIYLEPKGLLAHNLFLGHLATEESGPVVNLSVIQLFDLATALDEYATEGASLPKLNVLSWKKSPPAWTRTAAAVLLTVGVTTAVVKYVERAKPKPQTVATTSQPPSAAPTQLSQVPPAPTVSISPLPTPAVPPPLSSAPILPPPAPVTVPPTPTTLNSPVGSQRPTTTIQVNPSEPPVTNPNRPIPTSVPRRIVTLPSPKTPSPVVAKKSTSPTPTNTPEKPPTRPNKPAVSATAPPLPDFPSINPTNSKASPPSEQASSASSRSASPAPESNLSASASAEKTDNNTLFDNIPQMAEVRNYFEKRWKPQPNLLQTIEYTLVLNKDGSIQRIIPLGKTAGDFLDRTSMPLPGEPFVSPIEGEATPRVRLVLYPDGKVITMPDNRTQSGSAGSAPQR